MRGLQKKGVGCHNTNREIRGWVPSAAPPAPTPEAVFKHKGQSLGTETIVPTYRGLHEPEDNGVWELQAGEVLQELRGRAWGGQGSSESSGHPPLFCLFHLLALLRSVSESFLANY